MKKLIFTLLSALAVGCFALGASGCNFFNKESENNYSEDLAYIISEDGSFYILNGIGLCEERDIVIPDSVTSIDEYAFYNCDRLTSVYYCGSASEWSGISIDSSNSYLTNAMLYYYSESAPTEEGNYWHYDENGEIAVW